MPISTANGLAIHYEVQGDGPPLVMVHANPYDRRLFLYQVARFSPFYRVVTLDLRGYGLSDKPTDPFTLEDMTQDVLGVCDDLGIAQAIFLGVSVGSGIALKIGLDHAERARALVLVGGSSRPGGNIQKRIDAFAEMGPGRYRPLYMPELFAPGFTETRTGRWVMDMFSDDAGKLDGRSIGRIFEARAAENMLPRLGEIDVPVLVVNGEHDNSLKRGRETAEHIPGAQHVVLPGTGHACCIEDPAVFDAAMIGFFKGKDLWAGD
jgi:3-oxoadipate enol-lactonase